MIFCTVMEVLRSGGVKDAVNPERFLPSPVSLRHENSPGQWVNPFATGLAPDYQGFY
jgi:hypothetical protein